MKLASGHDVTSNNILVDGIQSVAIDLSRHGFAKDRPYHFLAATSVPNADHTDGNTTDAFLIRYKKKGLVVTVSAANSSNDNPGWDSGSEFDWLAIQE